MTYFDSRLTDTELLRAASVMQSTPIRTLATRLTDRGVTAERVRDRVLLAIKLLDSGKPAEAWQHLERCVAALDWKTHVPTYSTDPLEN